MLVIRGTNIWLDFILKLLKQLKAKLIICSNIYIYDDILWILWKHKTGERMCILRKNVFLFLSFFFRWGTHLYMSPSIYKPSVCTFDCCTPYLRNRTSSDHWFTCVKWWYLQTFSSSFFNFDFSGFQGDKRAKNCSKWKMVTSVMFYISGIVYDHDFWYTCVKWWYLPVFFLISLKSCFLGLLPG